MAKRIKWTFEMVEELFNKENHILISKKEDLIDNKDFVKAKTLIKVICPICGEEFETTIDRFKIGQRHRSCARKIASDKHKRSEAEVIELFSSRGYKVDLIGYNDCGSVLTSICPKGHTWDVSVSNFRKSECPHCKKEQKNKEYLDETISIAKEKKYKILDFIENKEGFFSESILVLECENGHRIEKSLSNIRSNKGCIKCWGKEKKDLDYVKEVFEKVGYKIINHNGYDNNQSIFVVKCPKGHEWTTTYANFKQGSRCLHCIEGSKGEREVERILDKYNVNYKNQHMFKDCKFKNVLKFDFYLPDYNYCIEYDGELHYQISRYCGGFDKFVDGIIRDTVKNEYCKKNKIHMIRIPYWDYDRIEEILKKELDL